MKKSVMQRWVKALRSRKFKQAQCQLESEGQFCCLGVLCQIAPKTVKVDRWRSYEDDQREGRLMGDVIGGEYQNDVALWAEMKTDVGGFKDPVTYKGKQYRDLVELNDNGASFGFIAKVIERKYKEL